jgi:hypothetical protein
MIREAELSFVDVGEKKSEQKARVLFLCVSTGVED